MDVRDQRAAKKAKEDAAKKAYLESDEYKQKVHDKNTEQMKYYAGRLKVRDDKQQQQRIAASKRGMDEENAAQQRKIQEWVKGKAIDDQHKKMLSDKAIKENRENAENFVGPPDPVGPPEQNLLLPAPPSDRAYGDLIAKHAAGYAAGKYSAGKLVDAALTDMQKDEAALKAKPDPRPSALYESKPKSQFDAFEEHINSLVDPDSISAKIGRMDSFSRALIAQTLGMDPSYLPSIEEQAMNEYRQRGELQLMAELEAGSGDFYEAIKNNDSTTMNRILLSRGMISPTQAINIAEQNANLGLGVGGGSKKQQSFLDSLRVSQVVVPEIAPLIGLQPNEAGGYDGIRVEDLRNELTSNPEVLRSTVRLLDAIERQGNTDGLFTVALPGTPEENIKTVKDVISYTLQAPLVAFGASEDVVANREEGRIDISSDGTGMFGDFFSKTFGAEPGSAFRFEASDKQATEFLQLAARIQNSIRPPRDGGQWTKSNAIAVALGYPAFNPDIYVDDRLVVKADEIMVDEDFREAILRSVDTGSGGDTP